MNYMRVRLFLESTQFFAHSAVIPAIASIIKSRVNPMSCVIFTRIHE